MLYRTVKEAKACLCPYITNCALKPDGTVIPNTNGPIKCQADACMAWDFYIPSAREIQLEALGGVEQRGYCGRAQCK